MSRHQSVRVLGLEPPHSAVDVDYPNALLSTSRNFSITPSCQNVAAQLTAQTQPFGKRFFYLVQLGAEVARHQGVDLLSLHMAPIMPQAAEQRCYPAREFGGTVTGFSGAPGAQATDISRRLTSGRRS